MFLLGEKAKLREVLRIADTYGCGNLIALLQRAWVEKLRKNGLDEEAALGAVVCLTTPYSKELYEEVIKC